jgi:alpha-tubulin suppressor-like RCC1 family protein
VQGLPDVVDIEAGWFQTCAVGSDGSVWCWGLDAWGVTHSVPTRIAGIDDAAQVSVGDRAACLLHASGHVSCWGGEGESGVLGHPSGTDSPTPRLVSGITEATSVSVQRLEACATLADGSAQCWGADMLGNEEIGGSATPVSITQGFVPLHDVVEAEGGSEYGCVLRADRNVYCWGYASRGTLGLTPSASYPTTGPTVRVGALPPIAAIETNQDHMCAVTTTGDVYCWGDNEHGQIGDGSTVDQPTPTLVYSAFG